ncbi:hypothetical protein [Methanococcoides sp. FTZ1]
MKLCDGKNNKEWLTCPAIGLISILIFVILGILIYEAVVIRLLQIMSGS